MRALHGHKRWYVLAVNIERSGKPGLWDPESRYLRSGGFDCFDLASWFPSVGAALDAVNAENMDPAFFDVFVVEVVDGKIATRTTTWMGT